MVDNYTVYFILNKGILCTMNNRARRTLGAIPRISRTETIYQILFSKLVSSGKERVPPNHHPFSHCWWSSDHGCQIILVRKLNVTNVNIVAFH